MQETAQQYIERISGFVKGKQPLEVQAAKLFSEMATPAERFRLLPVSVDGASVPVDPAEEHRGQWVLRRVGSNGFLSVDNQIFSVGNAYKAELVDVFVDATLIQVWSKNHLVKTVARERSGPVRKIRADGLNVKRQPNTNRQASGGT